MSRYFSISGYWKDDGSEFEGYIVKEFDDVGEDDDNVFYYGLSERDLRESSFHDGLEFVVMSFEEITPI